MAKALAPTPAPTSFASARAPRANRSRPESSWTDDGWRHSARAPGRPARFVRMNIGDHHVEIVAPRRAHPALLAGALALDDFISRNHGRQFVRAARRQARYSRQPEQDQRRRILQRNGDDAALSSRLRWPHAAQSTSLSAQARAASLLVASLTERRSPSGLHDLFSHAHRRKLLLYFEIRQLGGEVQISFRQIRAYRRQGDDDGVHSLALGHAPGAVAGDPHPQWKPTTASATAPAHAPNARRGLIHAKELLFISILSDGRSGTKQIPFPGRAFV